MMNFMQALIFSVPQFYKLFRNYPFPGVLPIELVREWLDPATPKERAEQMVLHQGEPAETFATQIMGLGPSRQHHLS